MRTQEPEVINTTAIVRSNGGAIGQALALQDILAQVKLIQDVMKQVMHEGEHYGTVPGCGDKKTLLQPGAQKLTMTFRLAPEYEIQESLLERGHKEYRVICTLKSLGSGSFVGQGVGCCSSMESKYRWRGGSRKCPECGKETIIKGKAEYGGGWLCYGKKGGCGLKWSDGDQTIEGQSIDKVENENPADTFNTVLKMAKKRAFVDATITATAASDIFTQDIGDDEGEPAQEPPKRPQERSGGIQTPPKAQKPATEAPKEPAAPSGLKPATFATRQWMMKELESQTDLATEYFRKVGQLKDNEVLPDLPLRFVPITQAQLTSLKEVITDFGNGETAMIAFRPNVETCTMAGPHGLEQTPVTAAPATPKDDEAWRDVIVPVPHKGQKRADYMVDPDSIGSLYEARHDDEEARKRLFGFVHNYEPKPWKGNDGKERPPSESDVKFRQALDDFSDWFQKNHPDERL